MRRLLARIRAGLGQLALLAALTVVAGALLTGAPRVANELTDNALRERIASLPYQVKDVTYRIDPQAGNQFQPHHADARLRQQHGALAPELRSRIGAAWWSATLPIALTNASETGLTGMAKFGIRGGNGYAEAVRVVEGRWPQNSYGLPRVEVVLTENNANILGYKVGTDYAIHDLEGRLEPLNARVVGIVAPLDPGSGIWDSIEYGLSAYAPQQDGEAYLSTMLTDREGMERVSTHGLAVGFEFRFRVRASTLDMQNLPAVTTAVFDSRKLGVNRASVETGLDTALTRFADNARSAQALFAVVQASALATLGGLVLLAAGLAVSRRRPEFVLLRARGASLGSLGAYLFVESLPVVPIAAWAGYYLGTKAFGRPAATEVFVAGFAVLALHALPVMAMVSQRRLSFAQEREDLATARVGLKRRTAELSLLVLAGLGILLLRRRGLAQGLDLYLVTVPVLLAAATAIVTLRAVPGPLALASRVAARARGTVSFLGLARAGRAAPATVGPVAVLVVAVCTTVFSLAIAATVNSGRNRAADHDLPADVWVQGYFFATDTIDELRAVPGVTGVSPVANLPAQTLLERDEASTPLGQVAVIVVDGPTFVEVARQAGREIDVPALFASATADPSQPTPALVSTGLARDLVGRDTAVIDLQGRNYTFDTGTVVESFPTVTRGVDRFLILPWQAIPFKPDHVVKPNSYLVAGRPDRAALSAAADAGQLRFASTFGQPRPGYRPQTRIIAWDDRRQQLELTGVNAVLSFAFTVGAAGGVLMALLAVGFAVLGGARTRGKVLSRLRTMGLTRGQGRRLLMIELAPIITVAVLTGGLVGVALPSLIGPALNLTSFTDGFDAGLTVDPVIVAGAIGLIMAGLGTALLVETLFNRRMRLGEVLRLGSAE